MQGDLGAGELVLVARAAEFCGRPRPQIIDSHKGHKSQGTFFISIIGLLF